MLKLMLGTTFEADSISRYAICRYYMVLLDDTSLTVVLPIEGVMLYTLYLMRNISG